VQAEYDAGSQQFILNTPDDEASKFWIGGAGQHGKICTIFAQLTVNGKWEGPHVFVVHLRDDAGKLAPGAFILGRHMPGLLFFDAIACPRMKPLSCERERREWRRGPR